MQETLWQQLTLNALGITALNGLIEAASGETVFGGFGKFRNNLKRFLEKYKPDGNHEIQKAIYCAYFQATLQICAVYGEDFGISVNTCIIKDLFPLILAKAEVWSYKLQGLSLPENAEASLRYSWGNPLAGIKNSAATKSNSILRKFFGTDLTSLQTHESKPLGNQTDEGIWLKRIIKEYSEILTQINQNQFEAFDIENHPLLKEIFTEKGLLMQARNAKEYEERSRSLLLHYVLSNLRSNFGEVISEDFTNFLEKNWFNYFCGCFQYQLSQRDGLADKFQNKLLGDIKADSRNLVKAFDKISGEFGSRIKSIEENLDWLNREQQEGFNEIKNFLLSMLPMIAIVKSREIRDALISEIKIEFSLMTDEINAFTKKVISETKDAILKRQNSLTELILDEIRSVPSTNLPNTIPFID